MIDLSHHGPEEFLWKTMPIHHMLTAATFIFCLLIKVLFHLGAILRINVITITILDSAQSLVNPPYLWRELTPQASRQLQFLKR